MTIPLVIDANTFLGFYMEDAKDQINPNLSGPTKPIFIELGGKFLLILDKGGYIEHEWTSLIPDKEWFKAWLGDRLIFDEARVIDVNMKDSGLLIQSLYNQGFPKKRGDKWYVRAATSARCFSVDGRSIILSEDLHFYDPKAKRYLKGAARLRFMENGQGSVAKILRKNGIDITCCSTCLEFHHDL